MSTRPETGPMKFEDDWCGVFIRGDNAFAFAMYLEQVFAALENKLEPSPLFLAGLKGFAGLLRSCDERHMEEEPQHATLKESQSQTTATPGDLGHDGGRE